MKRFTIINNETKKVEEWELVKTRAIRKLNHIVAKERNKDDVDRKQGKIVY